MSLLQSDRLHFSRSEAVQIGRGVGTKPGHFISNPDHMCLTNLQRSNYGNEKVLEDLFLLVS